MIEKWGTAVVLSGPSGVGKSTLVNRLRQNFPQLEFSISCTTRAPRGAEVDGREYHFLSRDEFDRRVAAGEFVEYADVFQHRYGTLKSEMLSPVRRGRSVLLDIDVQGAMQIRRAAAQDEELRRSTVWVMIAPPSLEALGARLRGRGTDSEEQIGLRLAAAARELSYWREYDYLVINDEVERASRELSELFGGFALRTAAIKGEIF